MTDLELVGYAEIHCETDRALFSVAQLRRLFALADVEFPEPSLPDSAFRSAGPGLVHRLTKLARRRLACPRYEACESGAKRTEAAR